MQLIANNITARNPSVREAMELVSSTQCSDGHSQGRDYLSTLACDCLTAGAEILEIDLQQHLDRPEVMTSTVNAIQGNSSCRFCLSAGNLATIEAGLKACHEPPMINSAFVDGSQLDRLLSLVERYRAEVILMAMAGAYPGDAEDVVKKAAVLIGAAEEAGIPRERILIDPGVLHVSNEAGQRHARNLIEIIPAINEAFEPSVRTTCWVHNISAGVPEDLRPAVDNTFLAIMGGVGLSSAFVDVLNPEIIRIANIVKILRNEVVYARQEVGV